MHLFPASECCPVGVVERGGAEGAGKGGQGGGVLVRLCHSQED